MTPSHLTRRDARPRAPSDVVRTVRDAVVRVTPEGARDTLSAGLLALSLGPALVSHTPSGVVATSLLAGTVGAERLVALFRSLRTEVEAKRAEVATLRAENAALRVLVTSRGVTEPDAAEGDDLPWTVTVGP